MRLVTERMAERAFWDVNYSTRDPRTIISATISAAWYSPAKTEAMMAKLTSSSTFTSFEEVPEQLL